MNLEINSKYQGLSEDRSEWRNTIPRVHKNIGFCLSCYEKQQGGVL